MQNLINYAIKYAQIGFSVLPMLGKKPLIKFADQPPLTVAEVKRLWQKFPYANIALRTIDFFVVDIDRHPGGADGFKSIKEYNHPDYFRKTLKQRTAGNGLQLFYLKRNDSKLQQNIGWLPGVDIKAHKNNYVVVAPSLNHDKHYKWENQEPIVTASSELIKAINVTSHASDYQPTDFEPTKKTATSNLFEEVVNGLGDTGGRNNALASFVGGLLFRNVSAKTVYELATLANQNTPDSLPDREFNRTFESMVKKEMKRRGGA
ncbi:bifunctional DNA primase/polymerase [Loigolactobacillus backii]|uniref:bifunctional DNA primase/polymerase n=1 Tax=Loigolactobacillus backii TaxID=375175 RepID=UPI0007F04C96|nr:bifunctional DNA primase/polymerase [Loigolactobacillus backii]ANK60048.1 DNA primase [Loigolactobacillus backii]